MQHPVASGGWQCQAETSARICHHSIHLPPAIAGATSSSLISQIIKYAGIKIQDTRSTRVLYRYYSPHAMQLSGACSRHFSNSPNYGGPKRNLKPYLQTLPSLPGRHSLGLAVVLLGLGWGFVSDWIVFGWAGLGSMGSLGSAHKSAFQFPAARVACAASPSFRCFPFFF